MKKSIIAMLATSVVALSNPALAATPPAQAGNSSAVLLQGFHWNSSSARSPNWYNTLQGNVGELKTMGPDIVAAQRAMEASNARIGVARAAMFPALTINADGGGVGGVFSEVFKWSSRSWVLGALASMPIIDGGRNRNNIVRSEAVLEESVGTYRQNVLVAFAEVEDNLAGLRILAGQAGEIDAAVVSARRSADLAQKLYNAGRSSYLELLDAQRNLAVVERTAVQLRGERALTTVALIRALGGGWDATQPVNAAVAQR